MREIGIGVYLICYSLTALMTAKNIDISSQCQKTIINT